MSEEPVKTAVNLTTAEGADQKVQGGKEIVDIDALTTSAATAYIDRTTNYSDTKLKTLPTSQHDTFLGEQGKLTAVIDGAKSQGVTQEQILHRAHLLKQQQARDALIELGKLRVDTGYFAMHRTPQELMDRKVALEREIKNAEQWGVKIDSVAAEAQEEVKKYEDKSDLQIIADAREALLHVQQLQLTRMLHGLPADEDQLPAEGQTMIRHAMELEARARKLGATPQELHAPAQVYFEQQRGVFEARAREVAKEIEQFRRETGIEKNYFWAGDLTPEQIEQADRFNEFVYNAQGKYNITADKLGVDPFNFGRLRNMGRRKY